MKYACWLVAGLMSSAALATAQESVLGKIEFENSGAPEAQDAFLNGVRMLHSFEWEDAAEAFQEAQRIDPDFALAFWGEALSYSYGHHAPTDQDMAEARRALQKLARGRAQRLEKAGTERERMYLDAVELLYGEGPIDERSLAYSEAMRQIYEKYPDDHEAATFYALSLMRTKVRGVDSLREDMQAGAISQKVFRENPDHPGAAHYIIHAYDDPAHAPIALYAAHKYAEIAPAAVHALHMPAHIFVQHGMWDHVAERNEASWEASKARADRKGLSPTRYSFHALYWLQYAYLQQGRYDAAQACLDELRPIANREDSTRGLKERLLRQEALQVVETERWKVSDVDGILAQIRGEGEVDERTAATVLFASGMSAVRTSDLDTAKKAGAGIHELHGKMEDASTDDRNQVAIMARELDALVASAEGGSERAREHMKKATAIAESMEPPSGPPGEASTDSPVKPPHELYGELLLDQGAIEEALVAFENSLLRTPKRTRSLLGAARAAAKLGNDKLAARHYEAIARVPDAGSELPGMEEARRFLQSSEDR
ncbi:MAG TPA: hypothetical protein VEK15_02500 [Vicinamibacteria bacterium]|nr:hypothetical protein [Vicinamibacteria bacterium]